jgi:hypothetical protein
VEPLGRARVSLLDTFRKPGLVALKQIVEAQALRQYRLAVQVAIGEDEDAGIRARRNDQTTALKEVDGFLDTDSRALGFLLAGGLEGPLECPATVAETNTVVSRNVVTFQRCHPRALLPCRLPVGNRIV